MNLFAKGFGPTTVVILILFQLVSGPLAAERGWQRQVYRGMPGTAAGPLPPCELEYSLSWNGRIKAGEVTIQIAPDPERTGLIIGEAKGKSTGLARALWRYDHHFVSTIQAGNLRPLFFQSQEEEKRDRTSTTARFDGAKATSNKTVVIKKTGKKKVRDRQFKFEPMYDLLSGILMLRSLTLAKGDEVSLVLHPFDSPYLGNFKVLGREKHRTPEGKKPCIKLEVDISKIDRKDLSLESYKKFIKGTIWVSDDAFRMPVEIRSDIFIGDVRVVLKKRRDLKGGAAVKTASEKESAAQRNARRVQKRRAPFSRHFRRR